MRERGTVTQTVVTRHGGAIASVIMGTALERPLVVLLTAADSGDDTEANALRRQLRGARGRIALWDPADLPPGSDVRAQHDGAHRRAAAFLALVSPEALADEEWEQRVSQALGSGRPVLPVLLRPCLWSDSRLGHLQPLPSDGCTLAEAPSLERACLEAVHALLDHISSARSSDPAARDTREGAQLDPMLPGAPGLFVGRARETEQVKRSLGLAGDGRDVGSRTRPTTRTAPIWRSRSPPGRPSSALATHLGRNPSTGLRRPRRGTAHGGPSSREITPSITSSPPR